MPYFTIVIPVYKAQKYIRECLNSIRNQTFENFEVILIEDGSRDKCPQICDDYVRLDSRFSVIHKKNEGSQKARKMGIEKARGEYIAFVDADDWVDREWLEYVHMQLEKNKTDVIAFGFKQEFPDKTIVFKNKLLSGVYEGEKLRQQIYPNILCTEEFLEFGIWPSLWSKIFRKELILGAIECVDDKITLGEDAACTYLCIRNAKSIYICDNAFYHYRYVADSLAQKYDPYFWQNAERLFDFFDRVQGKNIDEQLSRYKMYMLLLGIRKEFLYSPDSIETQHTVEKICRQEKFAKVIQEFKCIRIQRMDRFIINALKKNDYKKLQNYFNLQKRKNTMKGIIKGIMRWKKESNRIN